MNWTSIANSRTQNEASACVRRQLTSTLLRHRDFRAGEATECRWAYAVPELGTSRLLIYDGKPPAATHIDGAPLLAPVAWANFRDDIQISGWAYLEVESSPNATDEVQAYAAGALEAYLTRYLMEAQWENMFAHYCDSQKEFCLKLYDFLQRKTSITRD
ncbi:hypothetical protein MRX96_032345 [Rhipicephalus microplus]